MYSVLMPVDANEERADRQVNAVTNLPGRDEVKVDLLYVFTEKEEDAPQQMKSAGRVGTVRNSKEKLTDAGIEVTVLEESGDPAVEIIHALERGDYDSVVMGGRKRSPTGKVLFGSVTQAVLLESDIPITVTG